MSRIIRMLSIVALFLLAGSAFAAPGPTGLATLILHSEEGGAHVFIDGRLRAKMDVTEHELTIDGIEPGAHTLRITDFTELEKWWEGTIELPAGFTARAVAEPGQFTIYNKPRELAAQPETPLPPSMVGFVEVRSNDEQPLNVFIDMRELGMVAAGAPLGPLDLAAGEHYLRAVDPRNGALVCSGLIDVRPGATLIIEARRGEPLSSPSRPRAVIPGF